MKCIELNFPFKILSSAFSVPNNKVSNLEILKSIAEFKEKTKYYLDAADRRIHEAYGYQHRHVSFAPHLGIEDSITCEDLALRATQSALAQTDTKPQFLIHGTTTSSRYTSTQAAAIAQTLNFELPAFEIKAGCATGMVALQNAFFWMKQGYETGLIVIAETLSKVHDPANTGSKLGLADAAVALVLGHANDDECDFVCEKICYFTDGTAANLMTSRANLPLQKGDVVERQFVIQGDEEQFQLKAIANYQKLIEQLLPTIDERQSIAHVLSHQVNKSLIQSLLDQNSMSAKPLWINDQFGNIGSVSIPMLLHHFRDQSIFQSNERLLLITIGGGMNCQAQVWRKG